jgi:bacterioferritin-associated ferredoxin
LYLKSTIIPINPLNPMNTINASNKPEDELIICRCEGISLNRIESSIHRSGAQTVNQVKKLTRAGMGACQGRTCGRIVETILAAAGQAPAGVEPYQARPPDLPDTAAAGQHGQKCRHHREFISVPGRRSRRARLAGH